MRRFHVNTDQGHIVAEVRPLSDGRQFVELFCRGYPIGTEFVKATEVPQQAVAIALRQQGMALAPCDQVPIWPAHDRDELRRRIRAAVEGLPDELEERMVRELERLVDEGIGHELAMETVLRRFADELERRLDNERQ